MTLVAATLSAARRGRSPSDQLISVLTLVGLAMPEFVLGTILMFVFAVKLGWFTPALSVVEEGGGFLDRVRATTLPAVTLASSWRSMRSDAARQPDRGARLRLRPHG